MLAIKPFAKSADQWKNAIVGIVFADHLSGVEDFLGEVAVM